MLKQVMSAAFLNNKPDVFSLLIIPKSHKRFPENGFLSWVNFCHCLEVKLSYNFITLQTCLLKKQQQQKNMPTVASRPFG